MTGFHATFFTQMCISFGNATVRMTQSGLHVEQIAAIIYDQTRMGVAQIMNSEKSTQPRL